MPVSIRCGHNPKHATLLYSVGGDFRIVQRVSSFASIILRVPQGNLSYKKCEKLL